MASTTSSSNNNTTTRVCDGCGKPPRLSNSTTQRPIPLKSCSRCGKSWYHNTECQRRHYPQHKLVCRLQQQQKSITRIKERPGRGRCLVATQTIKAGQAIPSNGDDAEHAPLVPPVLLSSSQNTRCAHCFGELNNPSSIYTFEENRHSSKYPVLLCSEKCRRASQEWLQQEEQFVCFMLNENEQIQVLPSAILLYRLLRDIALEECTSNNSMQPSQTIRSKLDTLQSHADKDVSEEEDHHVKTVVTITKHLLNQQLQSTFNSKDQAILQSFTYSYMVSALSRIKCNGFSICDGESVALGIGLFVDLASNINHDCYPNALQTFCYGRPGNVPTLRITACTFIPKDDEICITYIDNEAPRAIRRQLLQANYHFECQCSSCMNNAHDDAVVGMKCPVEKCNGVASRRRQQDEGEASFDCNVCGNTDFQIAIDLMETYHSGDNNAAIQSLQDRERSYTRSKANFMPSSFYVQQAGDQFAQALLDAIDTAANPMEVRQLCTRVYNVYDELLQTTPQVSSKILKRQVLLYKRAKLRLFLQPDPRMAISELEGVLDTVSRYYPKDHEHVKGIQATIAQAFL